MPVGKGMDGIAQVAQHVPAVRDLDGIRRTLAPPVRIGSGPVARDHFHAGVPVQPGRQGFGLAIRQQVHDGVALEVHQHRSVAVTTTPGPVVDAQHAGRGWGGNAVA